MLLSVRVPATNERGPLYMDQALAAIHQANPRRLPFSLVLARHGDAVSQLVRVPDELRAVVASQLYAQYPDCKIEQVPETVLLGKHAGPSWSKQLRLAPDLFPIKRYPQFDDPVNRGIADPLTALLTALARDGKDDFRGLVEIRVRPARKCRLRRAEKCLRRLTSPFFRVHPRLANTYAQLALSRRLLLRLFGFLLGRFGRPAERTAGADPLHTSPGRLHEREEHLLAASDKLGRPLFETHIHLHVAGQRADARAAARKLAAIAGAFGVFLAPGLARWKAGRVRQHRRRTLRRGCSFLLSTEELATLWHPPTSTVRAPTMTTVESREFEPPLELPLPKFHPGLAVLGHAVFRGRRQRFGILPDDRRRHMLLLGKTGMGKTTLLQQLIASDIGAGRGVALLDPHGDLCESVLRSVPSRRTNNVVLFDAGDAHHPISFNPLACPSKDQRPLVASGVVSAFKKLYAESWGPRLEHILRNAVLALLEIPGSTMVSILPLLADAKYRASIADRLSDPAVKAFWQHEFAAMPPKLQAEAIAPVQNKIGHFVSSPLLRNILGQSRSTLDLRRVMDEGKVLIVNLSKGRIGDDASSLLGSLLVTSIQLAAMSRAELPEAERRDFFVYVVEFQSFATESFATILSEARKYRLSLTLANQYLAQMEEQTLAAVFGNIGTIVVFQVGAEDSEILTEQLGGGVEVQDLLKLPRYQALVRLLVESMPSRPFTMQTLPPTLLPADAVRGQKICRYSRQRYGRPLATVEREVAAAFA